MEREYITGKVGEADSLQPSVIIIWEMSTVIFAIALRKLTEFVKVFVKDENVDPT